MPRKKPSGKSRTRPKSSTRSPSRRRTSKKGPAHKRIILHPLFILMLLCVGVLLVAWTFKAGAVDIVVNGRVAGSPPASAAVITSPADGTHFSSVPITVSGTCPSDSYVEIFSNDFMSGSALCSGSNEFSLSINLFPGQNQLVAHVFNLADVEGPVSNQVTVVYDVPQQPASGGGGSSAVISPFVLKTDFQAKGYYVGQPIEWILEIEGGAAPYAINVDWGDGSNSVTSRKTGGKFEISHEYSVPGGYKGSYLIRVSGSDADGRNTYLQFFVIVNLQDAASTATTTGTGLSGLVSNKNWLWLAWPFYLVILLMVSSFWLGEREELLLLRKRRQLR